MTKLEKEIADIRARIEELEALLATFSVSERIKVRSTTLIIKDSPEYGKFGVTEDHGLYFVIRGRGGSRILSKHEADISWEIVS